MTTRVVLKIAKRSITNNFGLRTSSSSSNVHVQAVHSPFAVRQRKDQQKSVPRAHVVLAHGGELVLAGRVQHLQLPHVLVHEALLGVRVRDGGVVVVDEVLLEIWVILIINFWKI